MKNLFCLSVLLLTFNLHAQDLQWAKGLTNTTPSGTVAATCIKSDASGNIYVAGYFSGGADFDPGSGTANLFSSGSWDIFFARYDASGNYVFAKCMGGIGIDRSIAIALDVSGNIYVTGSFEGTVDFNPGSGTTNLTSMGMEDIFFAKFSASGNFVFAKQIGGTSGDAGNSITLDSKANIYITGYFDGTVDFDPGSGTASQTRSGSGIYFAKYSFTGSYIYAKGMDGSGTGSGNSIVLDTSNNIYLTGQFAGTVDFDPDVGIVNLVSVGGTDLFFAKFSSAGNYLYTKKAGGTSADQGTSIAVDVSGNVFLTGYFKGTVDFDPGAGTTNLVSHGSEDIYFAKYNASGNYVYAKNIGGPGNDNGKGIDLDVNGNVYITGYFKDTVDFNPGAGIALLSTFGGFNVGIYYAKYDAVGNYVYAKVMIGTGSGIATSIDVNANGNIYLTGMFSQELDFDPGNGTLLMESYSNALFIEKFSNSGVMIWAKKSNSLWADERGLDVAIDAVGNMYVCGFFHDEADFDPGAGTTKLISAGTADIFFAKYDPSGNYIFARRIGSTGYDVATSLAIDGNGNIYLTGNFYDTVDFDPGAGTSSLTAVTGSNIFFAKYDASGNYVYARKIVNINFSLSSNSIAVDAIGNVYLSGYFCGTVDFDPGAGTANLISGVSVTDIYFAKYSPAGNYLFARGISGTSTTSGNLGTSVSVDASGNIYFSGTFFGTRDFDPGTGTINLVSAGMGDIFFAKYSATGNYIFAKRIGGTGHDTGNSMVVDGSGNIFLTGLFSATVDFDPNSGIANLVSAGANDIYFSKYDAAGNFIFAKGIGGTGGDAGNSIALDGIGNIYLGGFYNATVDFDPGSGTASLTSAGLSDIFLAKFNATGGYVYAESMGGTGYDEVKSMSVSVTGNAILTGYFNSTADFDPGLGVFNLSSINHEDAFIARYGLASPLPVELISFEAASNNSVEIICSWETASEVNNDYFTVERSTDTYTFESIGELDGAGNSTISLTYSFLDEHPRHGVSYYRLKQTDYDGRYSYSQKVAVNIFSESVQVYPTLVTEGFYIMNEGRESEAKNLVFTIHNTEGRAVHHQVINYSATQGKVMIRKMAAAGIYIYSVLSSEGELIRQGKLIFEDR